MQYSNAALGITVRLLSQFITYFGSFNLSRRVKKKTPTSRFLTFCPEYSVKTKLVGSKAEVPDQGQPADGGGGFVRPREGGHGAFLKTPSLCQILHPPGRGSPPYIRCPLSGDGRTAPRTCGAVRTHGHTDTLTPFFPTARTPDRVKPRCKQKSRLLSPKLMATGSAAPAAKAGADSRRGRFSAGRHQERGWHTGFRGSRVFALPQEKVGTDEKDVKKTSFHRSSPPHAPSRRSRAKPAGRRASRRARAEGLGRTFVTSGSYHLTDPTNY